SGVGPNGQYYAIDTTNTTKPNVVATWRLPEEFGPLVLHHGLSISDDGTRAYAVSGGNRSTAYIDPSLPVNNGLLIYDVSDIQLRRADPRVSLVGTVYWRDGSTSQHTINVKIKRKPYIVFVDENGGGRGAFLQADNLRACAAGLIPFPL